jgi:molecular chaperone DnaK (HSP70)
MPELQRLKKNNDIIEIDEIWRFMSLKKENGEALKQLIIARKKLLPEQLVTATLQHLKNHAN